MGLKITEPAHDLENKKRQNDECDSTVQVCVCLNFSNNPESNVEFIQCQVTLQHN